MSISDKLIQLAQIKTDLMNAINAKGGSLTAASPFSSYSSAAANINTPPFNSYDLDLVYGLEQNGDIVSNFSASNFLKIPKTFEASGAPFEIVVKCTSGSNVSSDQGILTAGEPNAIAPFYIAGGNFITWLKSNPAGSWDIAFGVVIMNCSPNTSYKIKAEYTGSSFKWYNFEVNEWVLKRTIDTNNAVFDGYEFVLGQNGNDKTSAAYFRGSLDLSDTYININGARFWGRSADDNI